MYLFDRRVRLRAGSPTDAMEWTTAVAEKAAQVCGLDIAVWASTFGPAVGTVAFTTVVPDLAALEAAFDKLQADPAYLDLASKGQQYAPDGADDHLAQFVHPDPERLAQLTAADGPQPTYATVVESQCTSGSLGKGLETGVRIAQAVESATGVPTSFLLGSTGLYGAVAWITTYDDIEALERAEAAVNHDPAFVELVDNGAAGVFDAAGTTQLVYRRLL